MSLLFALVIQPARSQTCADYGPFFSSLGSTPVTGSASRVAIDGHHAFAALGAEGVARIEWDAAGQAHVVDVLPTAAPSTNVTIRGQNLFVTEGPAGVEWFSVSGATAPRRLGALDTPRFAWAASSDDSCLYVADGGAGLVCAIFDSLGLHVRSATALPGSARDVVVQGPWALVADGTFPGMHVVDVTNPGSPLLVASLETPDACTMVRTSGATAYLACGAAGVLAADIGNPRSPFISGHASPPGLVVAVAEAGDRVYAATSSGALSVADRQVDGTLSIIGTSALHDVGLGIAAMADTVICAEGATGVEVVRITHYTPAAILGTGGGSEYGNAAIGVDVSVVGSLAFLCRANTGLWILDVSNPQAVTRRGALGTNGLCWGIAVRGDRAYLANGWDYDDQGWFQVADIANPSAPSVLASVPTPDAAVDVALRDQFALVTQYSTGFQVYDVSSDTAPALVASLSLPGGATGIRLQGSLAYFASYTWGINIVDISDPRAPALVGGLNLAQGAFELDVRGTWVYAACDYGGLRVIDVADPTAPVLAAEVPLPGRTLGVRSETGVAYVSTETALWVFDMRDPSHPVLIGSLPLPPWAERLDVVRDRVYVAAIETGLFVLPAQCGYVDVTTGVDDAGFTATALDDGVRLSWHADGASETEFTAWRVTGLHPVDADYFPIPTRPSHVNGLWEMTDSEAAIDGTYTYRVVWAPEGRAARILGQAAVTRSSSGVPMLSLPTPNPMRASISLHAGPASSPGSVVVLDAAGRLVRHLAQTRPAQPLRLTWDGKDDRGRSVASGVYFVRFTAGRIATTRRVTLLH